MNELEQELLENIAQLDYPPKVVKRAARLVANKLSLVRALLHAEQILEEDGVEFTRERG